MDQIFLADMATLLFAAVTLLPWLIERNPQIFHPMKVWSALQVALVVPAALLVTRNPEYLHSDVVSVALRGVPAALADALGVYALCNAFVYVAYYLVIGKATRSTLVFKTVPSLGRLDTLFVISVLMAIGLVGFVIKLNLAGGLGFLLDNVSRRVELQRGLGPLNFFVDTSFLVALLLSLRRFALRGAKSDLIVLVVVFLLAAGTSTLFGGRKITLQLMITVLVIYSIYRPTALRLNITTLVALSGVYISVIVYFFTVLMYRDTNDLGEILNKLPQLFDLVMNEFAALLISMSYLDVYVFIVAHFDVSNFYNGATFSDLTTAFLPSAFVGDKPPVDEGLYVRYEALGTPVAPGTPAHQLTGVGSWPPETVGTAYMNGGLLWVPISGLIQGFVLALGYRYASVRPNSLVALVVLLNLFLNFELSNLRIVSLVTSIVAALAAVLIANFFASFAPQRRVHQANRRSR